MIITIKKLGNGNFIAGMEGVNASGDTGIEALENLVDIIHAKYSLYSNKKLGPGLKLEFEMLKTLFE